MDGNFKAKHLPNQQPGDQVWLMDGQGYMVGREDYKAYLKATNHPLEVSFIISDSRADACLTSRSGPHVTTIGRLTRRMPHMASSKPLALGLLPVLGMDALYLTVLLISKKESGRDTH